VTQLILVRPAAPVVEPSRPSSEWVLSENGKTAAHRLSQKLASYAPKAVFSGPEPKMTSTAEILAREAAVPAMVLSGLAEHARRSSRFAAKEEFEAAVRRLFLEPREIVYGEESADMTYRRFAKALEQVRATDPSGPAIAVSGGTAICLYVARCTNSDGFALWQTLQMPMAFVLADGGSRIEDVLRP
jgi:broad specificity phosphatase PhoE